MKRNILFLSLLISTLAYSQVDSVRAIEPEQETSYDNEDLLLISFAGLALLLAIYFLFRRSKNRRN